MSFLLDSTDYMDRLNASIEEYDEAKEEKDDDCESVTKFLYQEKYDLYEYVENISKIQNEVRLNWKNIRLDVVIRRNILDTSYSLKLNGEKTYTPSSLKKNKIIASGQYSDWKAYIKDSEVENALDIKPSTYQLSGIRELMKYPKIVLLLINQIFPKEDWDEFDTTMSNQMFFLIRKVLCQLNEKNIELSKTQINQITNGLVAKKLYPNEGYPDWLSPKRLEQLSEEKITKSEKKNIAKEVLKECEILKETGFITETIGKSEIKKENNKMGKLQVSALLAPILATMCGYYRENPFSDDNTVWKNSEHKKFILNIEENDDETKRNISDIYSDLLNYKSYADDEKIMAKEIYIKYRTFLALMIFNIYKIKDYNDKKEESIEKIHFLQYVVVEDLMAFKFVTEISDQIKKRLDKLGINDDEEYLKKNHRVLINLLREAYKCNGILSRTELGKSIVAKYFEYFTNKMPLDEIKQKLKKSIRLNCKKYIALEALYAAEQGEASVKRKKFDWKNIKKCLEVYISEEKKIREVTIDKTYEEVNSGRYEEQFVGRAMEKIKKMVEEDIEKEDNGLLSIKKFMVCNVVMRSYSTNIQLNE